MPVEGIKMGSEVKKAALEYYTTVRDLFIYDLKEIPLRENLFDTLHRERADTAGDQLQQLSRDKLKIYEVIHKKDEALQNALKQFSNVNGI